MGDRTGDAGGVGRDRYQQPWRLREELRGPRRPRPDVVAGNHAGRGVGGPRTQQRQHRRRLHRQKRRAAVHPRAGPAGGRRRHRAGGRTESARGRPRAHPQHRRCLDRAPGAAGRRHAGRPRRGGHRNGDDGPRRKQPAGGDGGEGAAEHDPADPAPRGRTRHSL